MNKFKNIVAVFAMCISFFSINSIVSAHYLNSFEERNIGLEAIKMYERQNNSYTDNSILSIQDCLVTSNPEELNMFDGKHKRYLSNVKISTEPVVNGFSFPGGFTYLTKDLIEMIDTVRDDGYGDLTNIRNHDNTNIYNKGTIAFVLAHEFSHFANEDYLRKTDKQMTTDMLFSIFGGAGDITQSMIEDQAHSLITELNTKQMSLRTEEQADAKGLDFLERIPQWGTGNAAIFFHRLGALEARQKIGKDNSNNPHSSTELRLQRVFDKMKEDSNGRIEIKNNRLYIDQKLFMGTGLLPAKPDVTALDRTYYVAGQLATAIKYGHLKKDTTYIRTQDDIVKNKNLKVLIVLGKGLGTKCLDYFSFTGDEYNNAITKTEEMLYFDEILKLINK